MPTPLYIICSESGSEDRVTGSLSIYNLIDRMEIQRIAPDTQGTLFVTQSIWITTAWARQPGDEDQEFEVQLLAQMSSGASPFPLMASRFAFARRYHRQVLRMKGQIPITGPGEMRIEAAIRRVDTDNWVRIEHIIELVEIGNPQPAAPAD